MTAQRAFAAANLALCFSLLTLAGAAAAREKAADTQVICKDGSTSKGGRGACRGHGGVDKAASATAKGSPAARPEKEGKSATAAERKGDDQGSETVTCKDGTIGKKGRGACRGHGGVDKTGGARAGGEKSGDARADRARRDRDDDRSEAKERKSDDDQRGRSEAKERKSDDDQRERSSARTDERSRSKADDDRGGREASNERSRDRGDDDAQEGPATARCKDGTLSHSKSRSGTCSRHGGVAEWLTKGN
ncbi:MAG TPA: DUF3761 domain-containing protein [Myxococcales bacterium]